MSDTVWVCDHWAVDGGALDEIVDCEAAAMLWLKRQHDKCAESAAAMNEHNRKRARERRRPEPEPWEFTPIAPRERGGYSFTEGCDTWRVYPREVLTAESLQSALPSSEPSDA